MATLSDCIISSEDMGLLKSYYTAIGEILNKYGVGLEQFCPAIQPEEKTYVRPPSVEYELCDWVAIRGIAELIFERYGYLDETWQVMVGFITSRLKARKFLTYRNTASGRMYSLDVNGVNAKWLEVPKCSRTEFPSIEVRFIRAGMNAMLRDLWIDSKERFDKELNGYKKFIAEHQNGGK